MKSKLKAFILAILLGILGGAAAHAADKVGGNCCADLEERIAELEATTAKKGTRKVALTVYGEVNQALLWVDTPAGNDWLVGNNANSTTKLGFRGDARFGDGWSAGYLLEFGVGGFDALAVPNDSLSIRHSALFVTGPLGTVWLGRTSTATDGVAESSVANVGVVAKPLSFLYLGDPEVFDGSRAQTVKWDSPALAGFSLSASVNSGGDSYSAAVRWAGEFAGFKAVAGIGYDKEPGGTFLGTKFLAADERFAGSASIMHVMTGLFVNVAASELRDALGFAGVDARAYHVQAGIEQRFIAAGRTTLFAEFLRYDIDTLGEADVWGAGLVQNVEAAALDLYVGARRQDDLDLTTVLAGARIKF